MNRLIIKIILVIGSDHHQITINQNQLITVMIKNLLLPLINIVVHSLRHRLMELI